MIRIGDAPIGGGHFTLIAGPCAVESVEQMLVTAHAVRDGGAQVLRGGVYKPRTSPHAFQGLGRAGLEILARAGRETGLPMITEVVDARDIEDVLGYVDALQVGARNMSNGALLRELGRTRVPVLVKRGLAATVDELLSAAEYVLCEGNPNVILCERGIRTFERAYRFTLDLGAVAVLKQRTPLPVLVDPSHAAGTRELVLPLSLAAAGAGADGLIVEVHPDPDQALCDGPQALRADAFAGYAAAVRRVALAAGRRPQPVSDPKPGAIRMSTEQNYAIVLRYVDEVLNAGDVTAIQELFDPEFDGEAHDDEVLRIVNDGGRRGAMDAILELRRAVPDLQYTVTDLAADGDLVRLRWTAEGTHSGTIMGRPATYKRARIDGKGWVRLRDGKIIAGGSEWDPRQLEAQLDA